MVINYGKLSKIGAASVIYRTIQNFDKIMMNRMMMENIKSGDEVVLVSIRLDDTYVQILARLTPNGFKVYTRGFAKLVPERYLWKARMSVYSPGTSKADISFVHMEIMNYWLDGLIDWVSPKDEVYLRDSMKYLVRQEEDTPISKCKSFGSGLVLKRYKLNDYLMVEHRVRRQWFKHLHTYHLMWIDTNGKVTEVLV